jgi:hypothetical protein
MPIDVPFSFPGEAQNQWDPSCLDPGMSLGFGTSEGTIDKPNPERENF